MQKNPGKLGHLFAKLDPRVQRKVRDALGKKDFSDAKAILEKEAPQVYQSIKKLEIGPDLD